MNPIRSPLAAVGGLIFLIDAVVMGALGLIDQPILQQVIVYSLVVSMFLVILMVGYLLWYIVVKLERPELLFNPADIHESAHVDVYARGRRHDAPPPELTTIEVDEEDSSD